MAALSTIFENQPFKVRNADEFEIDEVLHRFISPLDRISSPFDYESCILRGKKGSGKTMFLRANYAYFHFNILPSIIENKKIVIPIFLPLSRMQHISDPEKIYQAIIVKLCESMMDSYQRIHDAEYLNSVRMGLGQLAPAMIDLAKMNAAARSLLELDSDGYTRTLESRLEKTLGIRTEFLEAAAKANDSAVTEYKRTQSPDINDLIKFHKNLLGRDGAQIQLLLDEVGSLNKSFFVGENDSSWFDVMLNQFRTSGIIRTKVAVYPETCSDRVNETRYGNKISLEDNIETEDGYRRFKIKATALIGQYINTHYESPRDFIPPSSVFDIGSDLYGDSLEQIIYGSKGNMRLLVQFLDNSMSSCYNRLSGPGVVDKQDVWSAMSLYAESSYNSHAVDERRQLDSIAAECKRRQGFKFTYPYNTFFMNKICAKSDEYNLISLEASGTGRRASEYSLDYSFSVWKGVPTHIASDGKANESRTCNNNGKWNVRVCKITDESQSDSDKILGMVSSYDEGKQSGQIVDAMNTKYHFWISDIKNMLEIGGIKTGMNARFLKVTILGNMNIAHNIEMRNQ